RRRRPRSRRAAPRRSPPARPRRRSPASAEPATRSELQQRLQLTFVEAGEDAPRDVEDRDAARADAGFLRLRLELRGGAAVFVDVLLLVRDAVLLQEPARRAAHAAPG